MSQPNGKGPHKDTEKASTKRRQQLILPALLLVCGAAFHLLLVRKGLLMPPSQLPAALCLPACEASSVHSPLTQAQINKTQQEPPISLQAVLPDTIDANKVSLLIEKSDYRLTVFYDLEPVKSYPMVLGYAPEGDKFAEDDRKTPEGIYRIRDLYPHPDWSKFIWLDYPTGKDWRKHFKAKLSGNIALTSTVGSEIGIHGAPLDALVDNGDNWTWGCISLKNEDVDELYEFMSAGTLVEIVR